MTTNQDIFFKIDGIQGNSKDATHTGEIEVDAWDWEIIQDSSMHSGSGGGAGKATVKHLTFEHAIDRASPNLMHFALTGKHIDSAVLVMRIAGGEKPLEYVKLTLNTVIVTRVAPRGSRVTTDGKRLASEEVSLSFKKVTQEYTVQNDQGGSGGVVSATYDIPQNA